MTFKAHLEAVPGHGLEERVSILPPRPLTSGGESICSQILAHVVDTAPRKLVRKPAIPNLRSCFSKSNPLNMSDFRSRVSHNKGTSRGQDLPLTRQIISGKYRRDVSTQNHIPEMAVEPPETRQLLAPFSSSFIQPTPQRNTLPLASHPHPLRSHPPWPGHVRTRTARPRRRARLFNQAEKEALQKLLPAIEEEPEETETQGDDGEKADKIQRVASASCIDIVPSVVISDHDPVLAGLPGSDSPARLQNRRSDDQNQLYRDEERGVTYSQLIEENLQLSSKLRDIISERVIATEQLRRLRHGYEIANETVNTLWEFIQAGLPSSEGDWTAEDMRGFIRDFSAQESLSHRLCSGAHGQAIARSGQVLSLTGPRCHLGHRRLSSGVNANSPEG